MREIKLQLKASSYSIFVMDKLAFPKKIQKCLRAASSLVVITDKNVTKHCWNQFQKQISPLNEKIHKIELAAGEKSKSLKTVESIYNKLIKHECDRRTIILNLGGGVVSDIGGFVASTFMRGVDYANIPTTLLAQADSAIGGKTGVNLSKGKNLIGTIHQPTFVLSCTSFLKTLPIREFKSGLAEIIKHGATLDKKLFKLLLQKKKQIMGRSTKFLEELVVMSSQAKVSIVCRDESDLNVRHILNFGHTFGHAIERSKYGKAYLHGEAVATGMRIASEVSEKLKFCSKADAIALRSLLNQYSLLRKSKIPDSAKKALLLDKKRVGEKINFVFLQKIGTACTKQIPLKDLKHVIS